MNVLKKVVSLNTVNIVNTKIPFELNFNKKILIVFKSVTGIRARFVLRTTLVETIID